MTFDYTNIKFSEVLQNFEHQNMGLGSISEWLNDAFHGAHGWVVTVMLLAPELPTYWMLYVLPDFFNDMTQAYDIDYKDEKKDGGEKIDLQKT